MTSYSGTQTNVFVKFVDITWRLSFTACPYT